jgi:hypothetical protein
VEVHTVESQLKDSTGNKFDRCPPHEQKNSPTENVVLCEVTIEK